MPLDGRLISKLLISLNSPSITFLLKTAYLTFLSVIESR